MYDRKFRTERVSYRGKEYPSWNDAYESLDIISSRISKDVMYRAFCHYIPFDWIFDAAMAGVVIKTSEEIRRFESIISWYQDKVYRASMLNRTVKQDCGLYATIVNMEGDYSGYTYDIQFEDGVKVCGYGKSDFFAGKVRHPIFRKSQIPVYKGLKMKYVDKVSGEFYYETYCLKCGDRDLLSIKDLLIYAQEHEISCSNI